MSARAMLLIAISYGMLVFVAFFWLIHVDANGMADFALLWAINGAMVAYCLGVALVEGFAHGWKS